MTCLSFTAALLFAPVLFAQSYSGPAPAKADVPYLLHAGQLLSTEVLEARETKLKGGSSYTLPGANSPVKTPLASPIFLIKADLLDPEKLQLFQLLSGGGHRQITFSNKKNPRAYTFTVKKLEGNLFRMEVNESLPIGEYSIAPSDTNTAYCFAVN